MRCISIFVGTMRESSFSVRRKEMRRGKGGKGALSMPWRNSEFSEMLVQLFYEFASENARNAVIELQE